MKRKLRKRKPGEFEVRILRDGRIIFLSPDERLMDAAEVIDPSDPVMVMRKEVSNRVRRRDE